jgi:hypothetical protein
MIRAFLTLCACLLVIPSVAAQESFDQRIASIMAQFEHEPDVRKVQRAAARHAQVNPGSYAQWQSAAAWAHTLPERVKGEVQRLSRDEKDVRTTSSTNSLSELLALDDHLRLDVEVQWDLSKLIFNPDQLKVSREISNLVELREDILTTVNKLYFSRRRIQVERVLNPPQSIRKAVNLSINIASLSADIDALTGGWFSRKLKAAAEKAVADKAAAEKAVADKAAAEKAAADKASAEKAANARKEVPSKR